MYFDKVFKMTYDEYVNELLEQYGYAEEPYFTDFSLSVLNKKILRSKEGLTIHHIDEDKIPNLSAKENKIRELDYSFKYQLPDRLVYCNYFEHLILHVKIVEKELSKPCGERNNNTALGIGGVEFIASDIDFMLNYKYNHTPNTYPFFSELQRKTIEELNSWWVTVFVQTIRYFVEEVENKPGFCEWYGPKVELTFKKSLDEFLDKIHKIYTANATQFNQTITEYCGISLEH